MNTSFGDNYQSFTHGTESAPNLYNDGGPGATDADDFDLTPTPIAELENIGSGISGAALDYRNETYPTKNERFSNAYQGLSYDPSSLIGDGFFEKFSKYISLAFLVTFISLIFLQKRIKYMLFGKFVGYDKDVLMQLLQALSIGIVSSFSAYHTLN